MMKKLPLYCVFFALITLISTGCTTLNPFASNESKRQKILAMRNATLNDLYAIKPQVRSLIGSAPGYAVFSDANVNLIFASFTGGYGVLTETWTGQKTYMRMGEAGLGIGLGVKDFRSVFVFHDEATMRRFLNDGWQFGAHADAAAIFNQQGEAVGGEILLDNITIFQLVKNGFALQATVKGTKYWKDRALNTYNYR